MKTEQQKPGAATMTPSDEELKAIIASISYCDEIGADWCPSSDRLAIVTALAQAELSRREGEGEVVRPEQDLVGDLSMLVVRLVRSLNNHSKNNAKAIDAMDYLRRNNLLGSALRDDPVDSAWLRFQRVVQEPAKPARCVCEAQSFQVCGYKFSQTYGLDFEHCGNVLPNGKKCGHSRACHGGEK